jgi:hypothetical protein
VLQLFLSLNDSKLEVIDNRDESTYINNQPITLKSGRSYKINIKLHSRPLNTTKFNFYIDDCIDSLKVNDTNVKTPLPFCNTMNPLLLDLKDYLKTGTNIISLNVHNTTGYGVFYLEPNIIGLSGSEFLRYLLLLIFCWFLWATYCLFNPEEKYSLKKKKIPQHLPLLIVSLLYLFLVIINSPSLSHTSYNYHHQLTQAFFQGKLHIPGVYSQHDLANYNGHLYLYWGIIPSFIFIPFEIILGNLNTDRWSDILFGMSGIYIWYAIFTKLSKHFLASLKKNDILVLSLFAVSGTVLFPIIYKSGVWHSSQLISFLLVSLSLLFLPLNGKENGLLFSFVFFALACLTRTTLFLLSPLYFIMALSLCQIKWYTFKRKILLKTLFLASPFVLAFLFQLLYNYLRFDQWSEFGMTYHKPGGIYDKRLSDFGIFSLNYLTYNFKIYFLNPISYSLGPPYITVDYKGNSLWSYQFGIFIIIASLVARVFTRNKVSNQIQERSKLYFFMIFFIWLFYLGYLLCIYSTGEGTFGCRYLVDSLPFFLILIAWGYNHILSIHSTFRIFAYVMIFSSMAVQYYGFLLYQ